MVSVRQIDLRQKSQVNAFIQLPFRLYRGNDNWVPPILLDMKTMMNPAKHPFYEHSQADFFVAERGGEIIGRVAALENRRYNEYHDKRQVQFYFFECEDDPSVAEALFGRVFEWAQDRGLNQVVGPKGFGALNGYGMLVEGFEHRQMMTMMNYNPPSYPAMLEALGFRKEVDFISKFLPSEGFNLDPRIHRIADRVRERGTLQVHRFGKKSELRKWAMRIGRTYNQSFIENWEYYPLTDNEIKFLTDEILTVANPRLIKIITHGEDVVGFLFGFPDVSAALQRNKGRLLPFGIFDLLLELRRTKGISVNGAGILPEFQGRGGNALLYSEMQKTIQDFGFHHAEMTQVAETAEQMRSDLVSLGGTPYKNHRVYIRDL